MTTMLGYMNENNDEAAVYAAISGQKTACLDIESGKIGYHRNLSNSPAYRDGYDAVIAAHRTGVARHR